jgi:hypothetical protein
MYNLIHSLLSNIPAPHSSLKQETLHQFIEPVALLSHSTRRNPVFFFISRRPRSSNQSIKRARVWRVPAGAACWSSAPITFTVPGINTVKSGTLGWTRSVASSIKFTPSEEPISTLLRVKAMRMYFSFQCSLDIGNDIALFEDFQVSPACPCGKKSIKMVVRMEHWRNNTESEKQS